MAEKPNVLLVTADHWPASLLGVAGHPAVQTPTLDHLARNGRRFTNAYTECPVCIPARRTLLTGTTPRTHGDRTFQVELGMPDVPTMADAFIGQGYQAFAAGKLHVYPPRSRAGFDDVQLCEEGRPQLGPTDDYEIYLGDVGLTGQQFLHGMSNNDYVARPWHLDEQHHPTNWTTREMCRLIQRRDPTRPGFWYLSYTHPHPPLVPPRWYLDLYSNIEIPKPYQGSWPTSPETMPCWMNNRLIETDHLTDAMIAFARQAFYALCTHIDHQLRVVIGTLREEELLGNHGLFAKRMFYEDSAGVPMILVGTRESDRVVAGSLDDRLVGLQDVMPTLLDLCDLPIPASVDGLSLVGKTRREHLYGEYGEGHEATRMIHAGRYKLIYYAAGNRRQLFDLVDDPQELTDLVDVAEHRETLQKLTDLLVQESYGSDEQWFEQEQLVGLSAPPAAAARRGLSLQRGSHWPIPPQG